MRSRCVRIRTSFPSEADRTRLAGLNAWVFHVGVHQKVHQWGADVRTPPRARFAGAASLFLWALVIVCGRMIAYNWFDCDMHPGPVMQVLTGCPGKDLPK